MGPGVSEHVDGTQLDIGFGEHAGGETEQAREVIVDDDEDPTQTSLDERAKDGFPFLEVFTAVSSEAAEDSLFPVAMKTDDEVDAGGAEPVDILDLDVLAIEEDGEQVRVDGSSV